MHTTVRLIALTATFALALAAAACGDDDADGSPGDRRGTDDSTSQEDASATTDLSELSGRTLVVTDIQVAGERREVADGTQIRFRFSDSDVQIQSGCNGLGGSWERDGDTLEVGRLMGTMMACEKPVMKQEQWLRKTLEKPLTVTDDTFVTGDVVITLADREQVSPDLELAGQRWQLDSLIDDDAVSSVPRGVRAWVEYDGGELRVDTGCNKGLGMSAFEDGTLTLDKEITFTEQKCRGPQAEVDKRMRAVLVDEVGVEIEERSLVLTGPDGRGLGFTAQ